MTGSPPRRAILPEKTVHRKQRLPRNTREGGGNAEDSANIDFGGREAYRNGCGLVTKLGSGLAFTRQEASLSGGEKLEIVDQNFGFDPAKGITRVTLDPEKEHYYLDVRLKG